MKKIVVALLLISLFSCGKKEIQLPQLNETVVADVKDHSPIFMFFETNGKDTLIDVNRSNSISSTNWLFNIDKRLPLKLVIPEIQKLQAKKEKSSHKKECSENYFTYMDKKKKTLAFLPLVDVEYVFDKANEYERIKEKLIGETFEYAPEFNYIINGLLMRYESDTELQEEQKSVLRPSQAEYQQYRMHVKYDA